MTDSYNQSNINYQGAVAVSTLIFNSNLTEQTDIAFNDWNALLGKAQEIPGIKDIIITGSTASTIPPGTYDMTDIRLVGATAFAGLNVTDAVLNNLEYIENLTMTTGVGVANTVPTFQLSSGSLTGTLTMTRANLVTGALATVPMMDITAGTSLRLSATESSFLSANVAVPVIHIDATPSSLVASIASGTPGNNWGGGPGSPAFVVVDAGGVFTLGLGTGDIFWAANQAFGPTIISRIDDYESAVVADWSGVEPENVKTALDRIAAAVGPIA